MGFVFVLIGVVENKMHYLMIPNQQVSEVSN
jgi:hypothetical protein